MGRVEEERLAEEVVGMLVHSSDDTSKVDWVPLGERRLVVW